MEENSLPLQSGVSEMPNETNVGTTDLSQTGQERSKGQAGELVDFYVVQSFQRISLYSHCVVLRISIPSQTYWSRAWSRISQQMVRILYFKDALSTSLNLFPDGNLLPCQGACYEACECLNLPNIAWELNLEEDVDIGSFVSPVNLEDFDESALLIFSQCLCG